jgi:peptide/nickel transport system permease protein
MRDTEAVSWADIVWGQFRQRRIAVAALGGVFGLFVLAIAAPLLASNQPYVWGTADGWTFPLFSSLYDRNTYAGAVDLLFNAALLPGTVFAAVGLAAWRAAGKLPKAPRAARRRLTLGLTLVAWLLAVAAMLAWPHKAPYRDYPGELARAEAAGEPVTAVFPPLPWSPREGALSDKLADPTWAHPLGTDNQGRDTVTRLLFGTRISLTIGVFAVILYCLTGIVVGAVAGYFGGRIDLAILALVEVVMCIPSMFLVLAAAAFIRDRSIFLIMAIIAAVSWTTPARLVRAEFLKLRGLDFVTAAEAVGYPRRTIIFREILPNALGPVLVTATFGIASAILVESGMSFLGLGDVTAASWGQMLATGRTEDAWMLILAPGFAILVTVSLLNLVGEGVRDALDPKLRR